MRIPRRYAPLLFGATLSAIMVGVVSAFVLALNQGIGPGFAWQWSRRSLDSSDSLHAILRQ